MELLTLLIAERNFSCAPLRLGAYLYPLFGAQSWRNSWNTSIAGLRNLGTTEIAPTHALDFEFRTSCLPDKFHANDSDTNSKLKGTLGVIFCDPVVSIAAVWKMIYTRTVLPIARAI
jgi:hypothetical protein